MTEEMYKKTILWGYVGYLWHDRSLIVLNTVCSTILLYGIIRFYSQGGFVG